MKTFTYLSGLGILLAALSGGASAEEAQAARIKFTVDAKPLRMALNQWAQQSGLSVVFPSGQPAAERVTARVEGEYSAQEALELLLRGSGLTWSYVDRQTVAIRTKGQKNSAAEGPAEQMRVAMGVDAAKEEGSTRREEKEGDDPRQVVVKDTKIRPYSDANVDIPRTVDDAQPYYIFDKEAIEQSGAVNVEQFLKYRLTMNTNAVSNSQTIGKYGNTSKIDLRGLGADKTLVLVNGRRSAAVTVANNVRVQVEDVGQTDINGIPLAAIERIEVLPSSASGIYGGSALGGVINVVLKRDYSGGDLRLTYGDTWDAVSPQRGVSGTYGITLENGRTHLMLSGQLSRTSPIRFGDRLSLYTRNRELIRANTQDFQGTGLFPTDPPMGNLPNFRTTPAGGTLVLDNGTSLNTGIAYIPAGITPQTSREDLYAALISSAGAYNTDIPDSTGTNGLRQRFGTETETKFLQLSLRRKLWKAMEAFAEVSYARNDSDSVMNPLRRTVTINGDAPNNPFVGNIFITLPSKIEVPYATQSSTRSVTIGLQADLPMQWTGSVDFTRSESRHQYSYYGSFDSLANTAFRNGIINVFVSPEYYDTEAIYELMPLNVGIGSSELDVATLRASGLLFNLPSGRPRLTFGLEHRISRIPTRTLPEFYSGDAGVNVVTTYFAKKQATNSLYAEMDVPLLSAERYPLVQQLNLQLAGRAERYTVDAGTTGVLTYMYSPPSIQYTGVTLNGQPYRARDSYISLDKTIGLKYQPVKQLVLRASLGTAFLPPAPYLLIGSPVPKSGYVLDPLHPDHGDDLGNPAGLYTPIQQYTGGSPDLKPQNSKNWNAGLIWTPPGVFEGMRVGVEFYRIEQFNAAAFLSLEQLAAMEDQFPGRVTRDSQGFITEINAGPVNLFGRETEGMDFSLSYSWNTSRGAFSISAADTLIRSLKTQFSQDLPAYDAAGYSPFEEGAPKHKASFMLAWERGPLQLGWAASYIGSYKQYAAIGSPFWSREYSSDPDETRWEQAYGSLMRAQGSDSVSSQQYHDFFMRYAMNGADAVSSWLGGTTLQLNISNVFNTYPPLDAYNNNMFYASPWGDVRLRTFQLSVSKSF